MTNSLADILAGRKAEQPPEIAIIKQFLQDNWRADCSITMQADQIVIQVKSAALAGALRPKLHELQELCSTTKRLVIRIS